jgi:hypothetical protein
MGATGGRWVGLQGVRSTRCSGAAHARKPGRHHLPARREALGKHAACRRSHHPAPSPPVTKVILSTHTHMQTTHVCNPTEPTVLTNVIMLTPWASVMVTALVEGSIALATTGTLSTRVQFHSGLTGLL